MSEVSAETQATETETGEQQETPKPKPTETVEFWKQKAREQETRAKANAKAAETLEQIENASKTEQERAAEALKSAETRAVDAEKALLKLTVAFEKGLTPAQAKRLVGDSREDLEADADDLLATFKPAATEEVAVPSMDLGTRGGSPMPLNGDPLEAALRKTLGIS